MAATDLQKVLPDLQDLLLGPSPGILTDFFRFLRSFTSFYFKTVIMTSWATDLSTVGESHGGDLRVATSCLTETLMQASNGLQYG
jgi:hypothetical protein